MKRCLYLTLLCALLALPVLAKDYQVLYRLDSFNGQDDVQSIDISTPYGEVCVFNPDQANSNPADWQIGFSSEVYQYAGQKLSLGGYYSTWKWRLAPQDYHFVIPYMALEGKVAGLDYVVDENYYIPTDHGPHLWVSTDWHIQKQLNEITAVGLTSQYTAIEGLPTTLIYGPRISVQPYKNASLTLSYLCWGPDKPRQFSTELTLKF